MKTVNTKQESFEKEIFKGIRILVRANTKFGSEYDIEDAIKKALFQLYSTGEISEAYYHELIGEKEPTITDVNL